MRYRTPTSQFSARRHRRSVFQACSIPNVRFPAMSAVASASAFHPLADLPSVMAYGGFRPSFRYRERMEKKVSTRVCPVTEPAFTTARPRLHFRPDLSPLTFRRPIWITRRTRKWGTNVREVVLCGIRISPRTISIARKTGWGIRWLAKTERGLHLVDRDWVAQAAHQNPQSEVEHVIAGRQPLGKPAKSSATRQSTR